MMKNCKMYSLFWCFLNNLVYAIYMDVDLCAWDKYSLYICS